MENTNTQFKLEDNSQIKHVQRDENGMLLSFDIAIAPSKSQPQGGKLYFDLRNYSRENESVTSNKELREAVLNANQFLAENIPAYTPLVASIVKSGAHKIEFNAPDTTRFGLVKFPGITTNEEKDINKPVIYGGNLDRLTDSSQIGYERHPKAYMDSKGMQQDLRPAIMMLDQLAMSSKDLQKWPLPLAFDNNQFGRVGTIHNTMQASFFVRDVINANAEDVPTLDHLRQGYIPDALLAKGYPEPFAVSSDKSKQINRDTDSHLQTVSNDAIVRDRILANLISDSEIAAQHAQNNHLTL